MDRGNLIYWYDTRLNHEQVNLFHITLASFIDHLSDLNSPEVNKIIDSFNPTFYSLEIEDYSTRVQFNVKDNEPVDEVTI